MRTIEKTTAAIGLAAMLLMGACAHNNTVATTTPDYGRVDQTSSNGTTPAVIPGPAKVDSDGNVYTSSSAPGSGAGTTGTNTNVSIVPEKPKASVTVVQTPVVTTLVEAPAPPAVIIETSAPPAAVVVETPVAEATVTTPMTSSTTDMTTAQTTTHRRRMSKD